MTAAMVVPVIRTEHRAGRGTDADPARTVTTYWSLEGERLWTEHPADTPRPEPVVPRRPTPYEVEQVLTQAGVPLMSASHIHRHTAARAILALWDTPGCRVCGAGVPDGATECGSDHK